MRRRLPLLAVVAAVVAAVGLGGCDRRDALTIYSGRGQDLVGPLLERFSQDTGIPIDVRYGDSGDLALLIEEEGERSPADVFFSQSPGTVGFLLERGRLARLDDALLQRVDPRWRSQASRWVGVTGRQRVLVYNRDEVAEEDLPGSVLALTAPQYRGRVALAPSNASFQDFVTAMRQTLGEQATRAWLEGMAANDALTYANNNAIVEAVGRGEVPMGLVNHYYNERFLAEDPSLPSRNYRFPDGDIGSLVIEASVSVLEGNDHAGEAARFVAYLLSEDAQRYFAEETFEYPLVEGVPPPEGLEPLDRLPAPEVDVDALGAGFTETLELIESSGLSG